MNKITKSIPFSLKLKLRSLGWQRISCWDVAHTVHYLNTDFLKPKELDSLILPNDNLLAKQRNYELTNYSPYRYQEFVVEIGEPTIIEPLRGGVIYKNNLFLEECYALPAKQPVLLPYLPVAVYQSAQSIDRFDRAISLRHSWGDNNYFHFYNDILPKLGLLSDLNLFADLPIIVSKNLYDSAYFESAVNLANLENRTWIIQDKEYIKVDNLISVRAHELTEKGILRNLRLLNIDLIAPRGNRKILLVRPPNSQRNISNREEIIQICLDLDFECIDCSNLSLEEQIDIFANTRYIVGEHGAAFSNIIYRHGRPLDLMEIFPPEHISTCYFAMSQCLGFNHHVHRCHDGSKESYSIEITKFEQDLKQILSVNQLN